MNWPLVQGASLPLHYDDREKLQHPTRKKKALKVDEWKCVEGTTGRLRVQQSRVLFNSFLKSAGERVIKN